MDKTDAKEIKRNINGAKEVLVTLKSGKTYLYDGNRQFKLHENSWGYCQSYSSNEEYLYNMYTLSTVERVELLYDSQYKIIHNELIMDYFINHY